MTVTKTPTQQVVLAWADKTALEPTGRFIMRDMNLCPEFRAAWEGKAAMWIRKGTPADLAKAWLQASKSGILGAFACTFPATERDPLGKARAIAVAKALETA